MDNNNDVLKFRKFRVDETSAETDACMQAALDKLQTLYPGKRISVMDQLTLAIETDSYYSPTGIDTYELGLVDEELYAVRNTRDDNVITFR